MGDECKGAWRLLVRKMTVSLSDVAHVAQTHRQTHAHTQTHTRDSSEPKRRANHNFMRVTKQYSISINSNSTFCVVRIIRSVKHAFRRRRTCNSVQNFEPWSSCRVQIDENRRKERVETEFCLQISQLDIYTHCAFVLIEELLSAVGSALGS